MSTHPARRVVSLVPSLTESVLSWGVVPVACTRFCERPELPTVGGTKDPDLDAIVALKPDVVLLCEEENRLEDYQALRAHNISCHSVRIDDVEDVGPALASVADAVGVGSGPGLGFDPATWALPDPLAGRGLRVFVPVWRRPWMSLSGGTYGSSMLRRLGWEPLFADAETRYPEVSLEQILAAGPDRVLLPTEPYPFKERHLEEWAGVAPAALIDGQDLFWWGTRTPTALRRLAVALTPATPPRP
ncbi:MAG: helical backbone metal receptor [Acidimicrobiales bacterium]